MKLKVTDEQFEVLWQLIRHVRLGVNNVYSDAAYELAHLFDGKAADAGIDEEFLPELRATFSNNEGITLELFIAGEEDGNPAGS